VKTASKRLSAALLLAVAAAGAAYLAWSAAAFGPGISPDSMVYLSLSHHMAAGKGASVYLPALSMTSDPLTSSPPLCAVVPAVIYALSGVHPAHAALVFNFFLLGAALFLAAWIVHRVSGSLIAAAAAAFALFGTLLWRHLFGWVLSEPIYIVLIEASLLLVFRFSAKPGLAACAAAAAVTGLIPLARYTGAAFIATAAAAFFAASALPVLRRLRWTIGFAALASVPFAGWMARNYLLMRKPGVEAKETLFGFLASELFESGFATFRSVVSDSARAWHSHLTDLFSLPIPTAAAVVLVAAVFLMGLRRAWGSKNGGGSTALARVLFCYALTDYVFLESMLILAQRTDTADRYLLSIFTSWTILGFAAAGSFRWRRAAGIAVVAILSAWVCFKAGQVHEWGIQTRTTGMDKSSGGRLKFALAENPFPNPDGFRRYAAFQRMQELKAGPPSS
jgi:hypothetical protein